MIKFDFMIDKNMNLVNHCLRVLIKKLKRKIFNVKIIRKHKMIMNDIIF